MLRKCTFRMMIYPGNKVCWPRLWKVTMRTGNIDIAIRFYRTGSLTDWG